MEADSPPFRMWVLNHAPANDSRLGSKLDIVTWEDVAPTSPPLHHRSHHGPILLLSPTQRHVIPHATISSVHYNSRGWIWYFYPSQLTATPPFLLTDQLDTHCVFHGRVGLEGNEKILSLLESEGIGTTTAVTGPTWYAVLEILQLQPIAIGLITAFSQIQSNPIHDKTIAFWDYPDDQIILRTNPPC